MKRQRSIAGLIMPLFMITFAIIYWQANRSVPAQDMRMVTPLMLVLVALGLLQILRWIRGRDHDGGEDLTWSTVRKPLYLIASSFVLLFGASYDFPIAAGVFLALALPLLGMHRPLVVIGVAAIFPLFVFAAFVSLGVPLISFWLVL